jgi:type IV secretory pathway VirB10-like protein
MILLIKNQYIIKIDMFNQAPQKIVQTNRLPFLVGFIVLIIVMGVFMYKTQMNQKAGIIQNKPRQSIDISSKAVEASWFNDEKFKNIKMNLNGSSLHKQTAQEIETRIIFNHEVDLKKREMEDEYSTQLEIKKIEDKDRIEAKKLELEAVKSPLGIDIPGPPGSQAVSQQKKIGKDDLTGEFNELINMVKSTTGDKLPSLAALGSRLITDINDQDGKKAFLKNGDAADDYLENPKKKPRSPYEVKAGSYIPAALITGINSDLPGSVNAQVIGNVYDTVTGNHLLIPQGAKLAREYNSNLTFGQKRVQVVWNRIIFPDGSSIDLEKMQGTDIAGYTGFQDKVDNHYLRIYGNAVLLSLMGAGYDILNQKAEQSTDPRETVAASVGQKLADVSGQALEKNMDVQPTLIIDPGYKFKIIVMKDMVLENIEDAQGTLSYTK